MSNGSSHQAVGPFVNGQQRNEQSENQAFAQLAEYLAGVYRAIQSRKPIPPVPPNLSIPRVRGRDILFRMLDVINFRMLDGTGRWEHTYHVEGFLGSFMYANESAGKSLYNAIQSCRTPITIGDHVVHSTFFGEAERFMHSFRLRAKRYGHPMPNGVQYDVRAKAHLEQIRDSLHFDDAATKAFDHYVSSAKIVRKPPEPIPSRDGGKPTTKPAKPAKATKQPRKAETVADMGDEKSAKTDEKPAKAVDTFAKMFDWIGKLKVSATARIVLAEIVRNGHGAPFSWVGSKTLEERAQVKERQVRRILRSLEAAGHITIRPIPYLATQRLIFVNHEAKLAGIDPKSIALPENSDAFWKSFLPRFKRQDKPKPKSTKTSKLKADMPAYRGASMTPGGGINDPRRDKGFSAPKGEEKTHSPIVVSPSPPRGGLTPTGVEEIAKPAPTATLAPKSERDTVEAKKVSTARPPMDWPERNLPTVNRESEFARMVRQGRITHLHPRWLDGLACWIVRCRTVDGQKVFIPPKSMDDGWIVNTVDAMVVPLIDPENRRVSQDEFRRLLATGTMVAPDPDKPVVEPPT